MKNQELLALIRQECEEVMVEWDERATPVLERRTANQMLRLWCLRFERIKAAIDNPHCEQCESTQPTGVVCDECRAKEPV